MRSRSKYKCFSVTRNPDGSYKIARSHPGRAGLVRLAIEFRRYGWDTWKTCHIMAKNEDHAKSLVVSQ
jgi:hypothetical protein